MVVPVHRIVRVAGTTYTETLDTVARITRSVGVVGHILGGIEVLRRTANSRSGFKLSPGNVFPLRGCEALGAGLVVYTQRMTFLATLVPAETVYGDAGHSGVASEGGVVDADLVAEGIAEPVGAVVVEVVSRNSTI